MKAKSPAPWERMPSETKPAWDAFVAYRDMPQRSTAAVARTLGKAKQLMDRWCSQNRWVARVAAWESEADARMCEGKLAAIADMQKRHVAFARALLKKVRARLANIRTDEMTPRDVSQWLELAIKVERQALGADISRVELTGRDGNPVASEMTYLDKLDDAQLHQLAQEAMAAYDQGKIDGRATEN